VCKYVLEVKLEKHYFKRTGKVLDLFS